LPEVEVLDLAQQLAPILSQAGVWFVINDYPRIAAAVGAPLCHLGQEDLTAFGCRRVAEVLPDSPRLQFGLSTHAPEQAESAVATEPAYIAIGPVFPTPTKPGRPAVTLRYVHWASEHVWLPWFAIGGITLDTLPEVFAAGATRICVVSAILNADDVARACQCFRDRLTSALA
jgi:thiamine-phosphate pyrophosphorylase